jgi:cell division inhibitor SulA
MAQQLERVERAVGVECLVEALETSERRLVVPWQRELSRRVDIRRA